MPFSGSSARIGEEATAKRDLSDVIAVPGSLREDLHAALDQLLRRAQGVGAIRGDVSTGSPCAVLVVDPTGPR